MGTTFTVLSHVLACFVKYIFISLNTSNLQILVLTLCLYFLCMLTFLPAAADFEITFSLKCFFSIVLILCINHECSPVQKATCAKNSNSQFFWGLLQVVLVRWNEPFQKLATCDMEGGIFVWIQYEGRWSVELVNDRGAQVDAFFSAIN